MKTIETIFHFFSSRKIQLAIAVVQYLFAALGTLQSQPGPSVATVHQRPQDERQELSLVLKVNPLVVFGKKQVYLEMPVNRHSSVEVSVASFSSWASLSTTYDNVFSEEKDLTHWLFIPSYRVYFNGKAPHGAYFGLYGRTKFSSGPVKVEVEGPGFERDYDHYRTVAELGGGFVFGKQWVTRKKVVFDLFAGSGTSYRWVDNDYEDPALNDRIYEQDVLGGRQRLDRWLHQLRVGFIVGFQFGGAR